MEEAKVTSEIALQESTRQNKDARHVFDQLRARCDRNGFAQQWLAVIDGGPR